MASRKERRQAEIDAIRNRRKDAIERSKEQTANTRARTKAANTWRANMAADKESDLARARARGAKAGDKIRRLRQSKMEKPTPTRARSAPATPRVSGGGGLTSAQYNADGSRRPTAAGGLTPARYNADGSLRSSRPSSSNANVGEGTVRRPKPAVGRGTVLRNDTVAGVNAGHGITGSGNNTPEGAENRRALVAELNRLRRAIRIKGTAGPEALRQIKALERKLNKL